MANDWGVQLVVVSGGTEEERDGIEEGYKLGQLSIGWPGKGWDMVWDAKGVTGTARWRFNYSVYCIGNK